MFLVDIVIVYSGYRIGDVFEKNQNCNGHRYVRYTVGGNSRWYSAARLILAEGKLGARPRRYVCASYARAGETLAPCGSGDLRWPGASS